MVKDASVLLKVNQGRLKNVGALAKLIRLGPLNLFNLVFCCQILPKNCQELFLRGTKTVLRRVLKNKLTQIDIIQTFEEAPLEGTRAKVPPDPMLSDVTEVN